MPDHAELTSTSNCTDFQARRLSVRYRDDADFPQVLTRIALLGSHFPSIHARRTRRLGGPGEYNERLTFAFVHEDHAEATNGDMHCRPRLSPFILIVMAMSCPANAALSRPDGRVGEGDVVGQKGRRLVGVQLLG
jgi:hypothetical protein